MKRIEGPIWKAEQIIFQAIQPKQEGGYTLEDKKWYYFFVWKSSRVFNLQYPLHRFSKLRSQETKQKRLAAETKLISIQLIHEFSQ